LSASSSTPRSVIRAQRKLHSAANTHRRTTHQAPRRSVNLLITPRRTTKIPNTTRRAAHLLSFTAKANIYPHTKVVQEQNITTSSL
jgi:hypothetical protein